MKIRSVSTDEMIRHVSTKSSNWLWGKISSHFIMFLLLLSKPWNNFKVQNWLIVPHFGGENSFTSWRIVRIESKQNLLTHHASGGQGYPYTLCCSWKRFIPISFWYTFSGSWRISVFFSWLSECLWIDFYNPTCPYFWWIKLIYSQNVFIEFLFFVKKNYFSSRVDYCLVFLMQFKKATEEFVEWEVIVLNTTWGMATEKCKIEL